PHFLQDRSNMRPGSHQDGDAPWPLAGIAISNLFNNAANLPRLDHATIFFSSVFYALRLREPYMRMPEQALGFVFTMRRFRGLERNRIYVRLRVLSKDLSEGFIRLLHKALSRAKVRAQPDRLQLHSTDAVAARSRKQFHSDMSKPINGLLWIADEKYGLTVPVPSLDQPAEQLELREGGVLHFIH